MDHPHAFGCVFFEGTVLRWETKEKTKQRAWGSAVLSLTPTHLSNLGPPARCPFSPFFGLGGFPY